MELGINPHLEVITGPMFSGKSEELIRRIKRARIAGLKTIRFKPIRDTRSGEAIQSRNGESLEAINITKPKEILALVKPEHALVGIDEGHFFSADLIPVVLQLVRQGKRVIVCGLDLDYAEKPFEVMASLMALAYPIKKLTAVCMKCKREPATRSQRLVADKTRELIGDNEYEPRCLQCYEAPIYCLSTSEEE